MRTCRGAVLSAAPVRLNPKHLHSGGAARGATVLWGSPRQREGRALGRGATWPPAFHTAPAPTPYWGTPWQGQGLSHVPGCPGQSREPGLGPHLLPPSLHLPQSLACSTHGSPLPHHWGAHTAGFALTHQMPAGARAEPLYFPGWRAGAFLQANGSGPPRSPSTSPRLPSPALISAALGSWEN